MDSDQGKKFVITKLPLRNVFECSRLITLVGSANSALARYDGLLQGIVNPAVLLSPLTTREAVLSSRIEGTQATLDDVLGHEAGIQAEEAKVDDIREIVNYRTALLESQKELAQFEFSSRFLLKTHSVLMTNVRGGDKTPGKFRTGQNWIGRPGCRIEEASYVPPPPEKVGEFIENLMEYINDSDIDLLIQLAVCHAQFELIHPFNDGNGRIGRLIIPLFLYFKKVLSSPMFYLSDYLESNRYEYYFHLKNISRASDWNAWIEFFLKAICEQALANTEKVRAIRKLYDEMRDKILEITRSHYGVQALDAIFDKPVFRTSDFIEKTKIPKQTAMPLLNLIKNAGILKELREGRGRQAAVLAFPALLNITEGKKYSLDLPSEIA